MFGYGPGFDPYVFNERRRDRGPSLEDIPEMIAFLEAMQKHFKDTEEKTKEKTKKSKVTEGLSKLEVFLVMVFASPFTTWALFKLYSGIYDQLPFK